MFVVFKNLAGELVHILADPETQFPRIKWNVNDKTYFEYKSTKLFWKRTQMNYFNINTMPSDILRKWRLEKYISEN